MYTHSYIYISIHIFIHMLYTYTYVICIYTYTYVKSSYTVVTSGVARGGEGGKLPPPRNPGKFAKDEEQPRPRPAIRINSSRKL